MLYQSKTIRVNVPSRFTIGISTEPSIMQNAAERLLGLSADAVKELAQEIHFWSIAFGSRFNGH